MNPIKPLFLLSAALILLCSCGSGNTGDTTSASYVIAQAGSKLIIGDSRVAWWYNPPTGWVTQGVPGETSQGAMARIDSIISEQPAEVILCFGVNDIAAGIEDQTADNYVTVISRFREKSPATSIYIMSVLPTCYPHDDLNAGIDRMNANIKAAVGSFGITYIDAHAAFMADGKTISTYYIDGVHLADIGYAVLNALLLAELPG